MSKINLRGIIVPSSYDMSYLADYIQKGIIIPESTFRTSLEEASRSEPLTVYVNSPGGSVFAANEMVNAVREWQGETGQSVTVIAGALVASAASAFTIMVGDTIRAHQNSKMMFHGAWGYMIGGSEAMSDYSDLLGKINADIKARLVTKYNLSPETVDEWFAEGRAGWLTAEEMKAVGLADEIIGDESEVIDFPKETIDQLQERGLKVAAMLTEDNTGVLALNLEAQNAGDDTDDDQDQSGADEGDQSGDGAGDDQGAGDEGSAEGAGDQEGSGGDEAAGSQGVGDPPADESSDFDRSVEAAVAEKLGARAEELDRARATIEKQSKLISEWQSKANKLEARISEITNDFEQQKREMREALDTANDRLAKFSLGSMTYSLEMENMTWEQAVAECKGDYAEARKMYPALYAEYRSAQIAARNNK